MDRQERPIDAPAMLIEGAGDQLLAGAALAEKEHVDVLRRDAADPLAHLLNDLAAADDPVYRLGQGYDRFRAHQTGRLQGPADDLAQAIEIDRFDEIVEGAMFHGFDGRLGGAMPGNDDHGPLRVHPVDVVK